MSEFNLFLATRRLTDAKEDHLTEFLAACLLTSEEFSARFAEILLGSHAQQHGWASPAFVAVETQVAYPGTSCRPDMRFTLEDGQVVLVENKLRASQTLGPEDDPRRQLPRYLELDVDAVAYIRSNRADPSPEVQSHPRYVRPASQTSHFLWHEFFPAFTDIQTPLVQWLRGGFEVAGFVPPIAEIGDIRYGDDCRDNRKNFAKLWAMTLGRLTAEGWASAAGSQAELYLTHSDEAMPKIWISPCNPGRFILRFTPTDAMPASAIQTALDERTPSSPAPCRVALHKSSGKPEVTATLADVLPEKTRTTTETIEAALAEFVVPFVLSLHR